MTDQEMVLQCLRKLRPRSLKNCSKRRYGANGDGGYVMPDILPGVGCAFSLGVGGDVSWDVDIAALSIPVLQFDHTVDSAPTDHSLFTFFKRRIVQAVESDFDIHISDVFCLPKSDRNNSKFVMKMDIEGAEWDVLPAIASSDMQRLAVLVCEFHGLGDLWRYRDGSVDRALSAITKGLEPIHVHGNNWGQYLTVAGVPIPDVLEVTFVNRDCYAICDKIDYFPTALDRPCHPDRPELVLGTFLF